MEKESFFPFIVLKTKRPAEGAPAWLKSLGLKKTEQVLAQGGDKSLPPSFEPFA